MTLYRYQALSPVGDVVHGEVEASDRGEVLRTLRRQSLDPLRVEQGAGSRLLRILQSDVPLGGAGHLRTRRDFASDLATLRGAGAPLAEALAIMGDGRDRVAALARRVRARTDSGLALSEALRAEGAIFDDASIALVVAGEMSGDLAGALTMLADITGDTLRTRSELRRSLIYPAALIAASLFALGLMIFHVLPTFERLLGGASGSMPLQARIVFDAGGAIRAAAPALLALVVAAGLALALLLATRSGRSVVDRLLLQLPFFGSVVARFDLGRALLVCGRLLEAGSSADRAVELSGQTCSNSVFRQALRRAAERIREGQSATRALSDVRMMPERALRMIAIGETSGSLSTMLVTVSGVILASAKASVDSLLTLLPPVLTVLIGIVVAALIYSVLTVLLSMNELAF